MRFQDDAGPLGIFHNGVMIAEVSGNTDAAYALLAELAPDHPGCEVLAQCPNHPGVAAVDCLDCWPINEETP